MSIKKKKCFATIITMVMLVMSVSCTRYVYADNSSIEETFSIEQETASITEVSSIEEVSSEELSSNETTSSEEVSSDEESSINEGITSEEEITSSEETYINEETSNETTTLVGEETSDTTEVEEETSSTEEEGEEASTTENVEEISTSTTEEEEETSTTVIEEEETSSIEEEETSFNEELSSNEETSSNEEIITDEEITSEEESSSNEETSSNESSSNEETTSNEETSSEESSSSEETSTDEETSSSEETSSNEETSSIEETSPIEEETSTVTGSAIVIEGWDYTIEDSMVILNGYNGSSEYVRIPATITYENNTMPVLLNTIGENSDIVEIELEAGVLISGEYTFANCHALVGIYGLENINTEKVTAYISTFENCEVMSHLDLTAFNFNDVEIVKDILSGCDGLGCIVIPQHIQKEITLPCKMIDDDCVFYDTIPIDSTIDTLYALQNVAAILVPDSEWLVNYDYEFREYEGITFVNLLKYKGESKTPTVYNTAYISGVEYDHVNIDQNCFQNNSNITQLTLEGGTIYCTPECCFNQCTNLQIINNSSYLSIRPGVSSTAEMFYVCSSLKELDLSGLDTSKIRNMKSMFDSCSNLTSLNISNFNTRNVESMYHMFFGCFELPSLDVSRFDTSKVTNMEGMFSDCYELTSLNVSSFNTSRVTIMEDMFCSCQSLTSLNLSSFDISSVTKMCGIFYNCESLISLDLSSFDTSNVTDMAFMFAYCSSLTSLDLSNFNTNKVTDMKAMFRNCAGLTSINLLGLDTSSVTDMGGMFYGCTSLTNLDLSSFRNNGKTVEVTEAFYGMTNLETLTLAPNSILTGADLPYNMYSLDYDNYTAIPNLEGSTTLYKTLPSEYIVSIPKYITLNWDMVTNKDTCNYDLYVYGNMTLNSGVTVSTPKSIQMTQAGKTDIQADIIPKCTLADGSVLTEFTDDANNNWVISVMGEQIINSKTIDTACRVTFTMQTTERLTAGDWTGIMPLNFSFND